MKNLILSLIKDDLVYSQLLHGLADLGFDTSDYYLNLNEAIFALAGLSQEQVTEELRGKYLSCLERARFLGYPPRASPNIEIAAQKIYSELMTELKNTNP